MNSKYFKNINYFSELFNEANCDKFYILSVNVRSISSINKFNNFKTNICKIPVLPGVIAVQETWLDEKIIELYSIPGFNAVHCCRTDGFGGTSLYIRHNLIYSYNIVANHSSNFLDLIFISLRDIKINSKPFLIATLYRSQKCLLRNFYAALEDLLPDACNMPCVVLGDLNVDLRTSTYHTQQLLDIFAEYHFSSCHNLITRPASNSCIDCVFSNFSNELSVNAIETNMTDHNMIFCNVNMDFENVETVPKTKYMIDYRKFGELLDNKRIVLDESLNSSDLCRQLIEILSLAEQ